MTRRWPQDSIALEEAQRAIAAEAPSRFVSDRGRDTVMAGCFVCFPRGNRGTGAAGDSAWAAAALCAGGRVHAVARVEGHAGAPYRPGQLALREGPILERAFRALPGRPDVLLVNATGRDHPWRCGLAVHLGFALDIPSVGVTDRPLYASGALPEAVEGATSPLHLGGDEVARWVRVDARVRPVVVHPGWRTDLNTAESLVRAVSGPRARTPLPIRAARQAARDARASAQGYAVGPSGPLFVRLPRL